MTSPQRLPHSGAVSSRDRGQCHPDPPPQIRERNGGSESVTEVGRGPGPRLTSLPPRAVEAESRVLFLEEKSPKRKQRAASTSYPDRIADDALGLGPVDDILVFPSVAYFLPVRDDDEDLGGVLSGPLVGTEQLFSAGKRRVQRRLGRAPPPRWQRGGDFLWRPDACGPEPPPPPVVRRPGRISVPSAPLSWSRRRPRGRVAAWRTGGSGLT